MKVLDNASDSREKPAAPLRMLKTRQATKRIAFISNGSGVGAPLDDAIDACLRQAYDLLPAYHTDDVWYPRYSDYNYS